MAKNNKKSKEKFGDKIKNIFKLPQALPKQGPSTGKLFSAPQNLPRIDSGFANFRRNKKNSTPTPITAPSIIDQHINSTVKTKTTNTGSNTGSNGGASMSGSSNIQSQSAISSGPARNEVGAITGEIQGIDNTLQNQRAEIQKKRDKAISGLDDLNTSTEDTFSDFQKQMENIQSGSVPYSPGESAMMDSIKQQFDILRRRQIVANQQFEGGTNVSLAMNGYNSFAPELAQQEIQQAVQVGIDKLKELDLQLADKLNEVRQSIISNKVDLIKENFNMYKESLDQRRTSLNDLRGLLNDSESYLTNAINEGMTSDIKEYNLAVSQGYDGTYMEYLDYIRGGALSGKNKSSSSSSSSVSEEFGFDGDVSIPEGLKNDLSEEDMTSFGASLKSGTPPAWFNRQYLLSEDDPAMLTILEQKKFIPRKQRKANATLADAGLTHDALLPSAQGGKWEQIQAALPKINDRKVKKAWNKFRTNPQFQGFQLGTSIPPPPSSSSGSSSGRNPYQ